MHSSYFITGTDTDVGKTWATVALMQLFKQQGQRVIGMKPVAAGCELTNDGRLQHADALLLQAHSSMFLPYAQINPYAYRLPISPHLAGADNPAKIDLIGVQFKQLQGLADSVLVEGAGGWYSPLNQQQANSDLAQYLAIPVILVVAIKLGCINHARLSYQAICQAGLPCAGWIAVCTEAKVLKPDAIIDSMQKLLATPLLGILPYIEQADFDYLATQLTVP